MWIAIMGAPRADARVWRGRRTLAALDAVVWPVAWMVLFSYAPMLTGAVFPLVCALAILSAARRLIRAVWTNERYWFTTWRWFKVVATMLATGALLKLTMAASL